MIAFATSGGTEIHLGPWTISSICENPPRVLQYCEGRGFEPRREQVFFPYFLFSFNEPSTLHCMFLIRTYFIPATDHTKKKIRSSYTRWVDCIHLSKIKCESVMSSTIFFQNTFFLMSRKNTYFLKICVHSMGISYSNQMETSTSLPPGLTPM